MEISIKIYSKDLFYTYIFMKTAIILLIGKTHSIGKMCRILDWELGVIVVPKGKVKISYKYS